MVKTTAVLGGLSFPASSTQVSVTLYVPFGSGDVGL
jgi:hypothetical protein